jgi:hypothetical protein
MSRDVARVFADILIYDGDLVRDWQIYIDVTPVYA